MSPLFAHLTSHPENIENSLNYRAMLITETTAFRPGEVWGDDYVASWVKNMGIPQHPPSYK